MNEIQNNKVNLCDSCSQVYPDCTSQPEDVYFGDGIGHDNICACSEYQPEKRTEERTKTHACDSISRQDTVDVIASMIAYHKTLDDAYWYVKSDAPSAQPEQRWIPVTERLPDEWKRVLIQNDEGLFLVGFVKDRGWGKEWFYQYEMYDYDEYIESEQGKIVAWCELPDRWKG